jgi:ribosome silencing factor RsfS/YbeB/iojap
VRPAISRKPLSSAKQLLALLEQTLSDHKAEDIVAIDLAGKSSMADFMLVASGRSNRQVAALSDNLVEVLKANDRRVSVEGKAHGDWVLVDAGEVIVHLFRPEVRTFYQLEKMWQMPADAAPARRKRPARKAATEAVSSEPEAD